MSENDNEIERKQTEKGKERVIEYMETEREREGERRRHTIEEEGDIMQVDRWKDRKRRKDE